MNVLGVVEMALGQRLDKGDCIEKLEGSDDWLIPLWKAVRPLESVTDAELRSFVPPKREVGWLQPYLPYRISYDGGREFVGVLPVYHGPGSHPDPSRTAALLSRHALYCHRVVIDDPVWWAVCDQVGTSYGGEPGSLSARDKAKLLSPERKCTILSWLTVLKAIRPLLESERVVLLPPRLHDYDRGPHDVEVPADLAEPAAANKRLHELQELQADLERNGEFFDLPDQGLDNDTGRQLFARNWFSQAVEDMGLQLAASAFHNNMLDLSPVNFFHPIALQKLLAAAEAEVAKRFAGTTGPAARLATLTSLPAFLDVGEKPSRLVDLAAKDDDFEAWRAAMGRALGKIAETGTRDDVEVGQIFHDELFDVVRSLVQARKKASWQGAFAPSVSSFTVSAFTAGGAAAAAAIAGATVAMPFSLPAAAVAYGARAAWAYCRGGAARRQGTAAQELYKILSPSA